MYMFLKAHIFKSEIILKPNNLYYFCLFHSNWDAENVKNTFVWLSFQPMSCMFSFTTQSESDLGIICLSSSFKDTFKKNHKPMIISFLKRLFLQGITFCAILNPTAFNSFMVVSSLSLRWNDFCIAGPFFVLFYLKDKFIRDREHWKRKNLCTPEMFRWFLNRELNIGAFLGIQLEIPRFWSCWAQCSLACNQPLLSLALSDKVGAFRTHQRTPYLSSHALSSLM